MKLSSKFKRLALLVAISAITVGQSASDAAAASPVKSLTTVIYGSPPALAPFFVSAPGSYTAYSASGAVVDSGPVGSLVARGVLPAQPPKSTQIETFRTIISPSGNGTLELHCSDISRPTSPYATTGSCAVLGATGLYAGLRGTGQLTGMIGAGTLTDTIVF
jgi:hypothetical protein